MKKPFLHLSILLFLASTTSSAKTGIWPANDLPKAGMVNNYFYNPAIELNLPEKIYAFVFYKNDRFRYQRTELVKSDDKYQFAVAVPDSTAVMVVGIFDERGELIDNNGGRGYIMPLYDGQGRRFTKTGIKTAETLPMSCESFGLQQEEMM